MRHPRALTPADASAFIDHLIRLSPNDRRLRFGAAQSDAQIMGYVRALSVIDAALFGVFNGDQLIGAAELWWIRPTFRAPGPLSAELALSVDASYRRTGVGAALTRRCVTLARACGAPRIQVFCASDNHAMRALLRSAGADGAIEGGEYAADFVLPPANGASFLELATQQMGAAVETGFEALRRAAAAVRPHPGA